MKVAFPFAPMYTFLARCLNSLTLIVCLCWSPSGSSWKSWRSRVLIFTAHVRVGVFLMDGMFVPCVWVGGIVSFCWCCVNLGGVVCDMFVLPLSCLSAIDTNCSKAITNASANQEDWLVIV